MAMASLSTAHDGRRQIRCIDPATGAEIGAVAIMSADEVRAAVARARAAQPAWHALGARERVARIRAFVDAVIADEDRIVAILRSETGKVLPDAIVELAVNLSIARHFSRLAVRLERGSKVGFGLLPTKKDRIAYPPLGVAGVISPWNYPVHLAQMQIFPALLAGNAVVHKPSEHTPLVGIVLGELFRKVGAPVEVVTGDGATGAALCEAGVDVVSFTGSIATGRKVMAACAKGPIPCLLELGGKDPVVVLEDANVARAADASVTAAFFNAGQMCTSAERIYVHRSRYDEFVDKAAARTRALRLALDGDVGAMTTPQQLEVVDRHVKEAVAQGAKVLVGGKRAERRGTWYEPTILVDVKPEMTVMREETFGPVLPIATFDTDAEAVRLANETEYGLGAAVFGSPARARRVAEQLEVGMVSVNDVLSYAFNPKLPWGGAKRSGVGRSLAEEGIVKFCRMTAISEDRLGLRRELYWYPYSPRTTKLYRALLALQSPSWSARLRRLWAGAWRSESGRAPVAPPRAPRASVGGG